MRDDAYDRTIREAKMKFMDQSLFEVCVLNLAAFKAQSHEAYTTLKAGLYDSYHPSFPGDNLWFVQLNSAINETTDVAQKIAGDKKLKLLLLAAEVRKHLNDDLAPKAGMLQKLGLGGAYFTESHPAPSSRPEIAANNIKVLLVRLNSSEHMST